MNLKGDRWGLCLMMDGYLVANGLLELPEVVENWRQVPDRREGYRGGVQRTGIQDGAEFVCKDLIGNTNLMNAANSLPEKLRNRSR
ncbi:hypothetical protein IFM89_039152 [Coptis chinensis]|uniref:Uncharacterized protein n=1 Tax=Coptis chinensis TaxID=261450 RepID=A0A835HT36_9MAGN|nr:hypothetical protein IFM89_039152 [Coptis chinensis]